MPQLLQLWSALADKPFSRSDNILSSYRLFIRKGITNTSSIYDELTMQDADGLGEMDAGVDISGNCLVTALAAEIIPLVHILFLLNRYY